MHGMASLTMSCFCAASSPPPESSLVDTLPLPRTTPSSTITMYAFALVNLLLAASAIAIPTSAERRTMRDAKRASGRSSQPLMSIEQAAADVVKTGGQTQETYSTNWAGAIWSKPANTITAVTGTFTVPTASGSGSASAWVGIDGASCSSAILQTGVDFNSDGSYDSWYEWFPAGAVDFDGLTINSGDVIKLTVTATSTTAGSAVIENTTSGQKVNQALTSSSALCEQDAEWIVEDFEENGGLVPFANFGTVTFSDASATTPSGSLSPAGASISDIQQNGQTLTQTTISGNDVTIKHT
ncbi:hypothetical protein CONPUDRAFT_164374 [Coniophora puteana RWD-64-598 SS2]|uniref:Acid proteinase n=1 Tax=Coniophora puteana (strain RWD-64-598) TaxID=741705 RepID=A0A5M3MXR1_CONPW|nr:uncharacterized protein CONPUDRAFT_164374 [Coniophora puteana RWD-64-598 SS2]EIW83421.1 hypothetical protein CONPUDRAFT_164374 [Coniophora puteana RWD-64-598 SS2]